MKTVMPALVVTVTISWPLGARGARVVVGIVGSERVEVVVFVMVGCGGVSWGACLGFVLCEIE